MTYVPKDGTISLFKNDRKEKDNHPDYRGDGMIHGTRVKVAAWLKEGKKGKFLSLKVDDDAGEGRAPSPRHEDDSDIPW